MHQIVLTVQFASIVSKFTWLLSTTDHLFVRRQNSHECPAEDNYSTASVHKANLD